MSGNITQRCVHETGDTPIIGSRGCAVYPAWREFNAFICLDPRFEAGIEQSVIAEAPPHVRDSSGGPPLAGYRIAVKDSIDVAGMPCTLATPALRRYVAERVAAAVSRLRGAEAEILGKANMHESAYGITSNNPTFGLVRNVHDRNRFALGSSGGTAAAIAAGLVRAGLGTDTGGSSRIPAALSGIVRFRPTGPLSLGRRRAALTHEGRDRSNGTDCRRRGSARQGARRNVPRLVSLPPICAASESVCHRSTSRKIWIPTSRVP